jgi:hypothetical protein
MFLFVGTSGIKFESDRINVCPTADEFTAELIEGIINNDKYHDFRLNTGLQNVNFQEITVLTDPTYTEICQSLKYDGFYEPEPDSQPITKAYFKSDNHFYVIVHYSDSVLREENGMIKITSGPVGAVKVYDANLNSINSDFIW